MLWNIVEHLFRDIIIGFALRTLGDESKFDLYLYCSGTMKVVVVCVPEHRSRAPQHAESILRYVSVLFQNNKSCYSVFRNIVEHLFRDIIIGFAFRTLGNDKSKFDL